MLRAELRKLRTTRTTRWLWLIAIVVIILGDYSTVSGSDPADLTGHLRDQPFHVLSAVNLSLIALLIGVRSITDEYRHDTISWTLLTQPHRRTALVAKATVAAGYGVVVGLTAQLFGVGAALLAVRGAGGAFDVDLSDAAAIAGLTLACAIWAVLGVAIGTLIRNQVLAVALAFVWVLAVENIGQVMLGGAGPFLPGQAAASLGAAGASNALPPLVGLAVLAAYVLLLMGVADRSFDHRPLFHAG